jgi:hypothetical protein
VTARARSYSVGYSEASCAAYASAPNRR